MGSKSGRITKVTGSKSSLRKRLGGEATIENFSRFIYLSRQSYADHSPGSAKSPFRTELNGAGKET
jgi:hypothetical protein